MWLGAGGVIAIFVSAWACIWAARASHSRAWWRRPTTTVAFISMMISLTLISMCSAMVFPIGELSRSLSPDKKLAVHALMSDTYDPIWSTGVGLFLFVAVLIWSVRRSERTEIRGVWWIHLITTLGVGAPTAASVALFLFFHIRFMMRDPTTVTLGTGANATRALVFCSFFAWIGLLGAIGWAVSRGGVALLQLRSGR